MTCNVVKFGCEIEKKRQCWTVTFSKAEFSQCKSSEPSVEQESLRRRPS